MEEMTNEVRKVLSCRSVRDRIAVPLDCALCPVGLLNTVGMLVREGVLTWIDRATLHHVIHRGSRVAVLVDVYELTRKGIDLCNEHGIKQQ